MYRDPGWKFGTRAPGFGTWTPGGWVTRQVRHLAASEACPVSDNKTSRDLRIVLVSAHIKVGLFPYD